MSNSIPSLINALYQRNNEQGNRLNNRLMSFTQTDDNRQPNPFNVNDSDVSLSLKAQKLSAISKEFFNGTIASNQIEALTQSLYENGFLSGDDLQSLGQTETNQSTITQSRNFVNSFLFTAANKGDDDTVSMLEPIASALANMDSGATNNQRQIEIIALDNANQILSKFTELGADDALISQFENVVDVLQTLDTLRQSDQINQGIAEYETIQNEYDALFKGNGDP